MRQHGQPCPLMVVEVVDGTNSRQISPMSGVTRRESLRAETCWKERNLVVIEKWDGKKVIGRWTGARYGPRTDFEPYAAHAGMQMGFMGAEQTLFIADVACQGDRLALAPLLRRPPSWWTGRWCGCLMRQCGSFQ